MHAQITDNTIKQRRLGTMEDVDLVLMLVYFSKPGIDLKRAAMFFYQWDDTRAERVIGECFGLGFIKGNQT